MIRPAGVPARAVTVAGRIWLKKTAPSPAMPVAIPTWRKVLDAPEAIPLCSGGTTETAADATTGLVIPMPKPATMNPGRSTVHVELAPTCVARSHPRAIRISPSPSR